MAEVIRIATAGDYDAKLPKLNLAQRQIPIRVRLDEDLRHDLDAVRQLRVAANKGAVPLEAVADIRLGSGPAQIDRLDRQRNVTIDVELGSRDLGAVVAEANQLPALKGLPPGISRPPSGDAERMAELFGSFGSAMLIGVLCIYVVLVLLFHDFLQPATILADPAALGRRRGARPAGDAESGLDAVVIGILMLMGIVTKNAIMLVDFAVEEERARRAAATMPSSMPAASARARSS
jgi:multidrug efflux pump subunit AcrB